MEFSPSGQFEDRRSLRAMTRPDPIPFTAVTAQENGATLASATLTIQYRADGASFNADNLQAFDRATGAMFWNPAAIDLENLGGVHISMDYIKPGLIPVGVHPATAAHHDIAGPGRHGWNLWQFQPYLFGGETGVVVEDRYRTMNYDEVLAVADFEKLPQVVRDLIRERAKYPPGVLSKAGYFLYNDTPTPVLDDQNGWITARPDEAGYQDWYLFYYRKDMARALLDYRLLCGATPLIPRYVFGLWYSRFQPVTGAEWREIVADFEKHELPLDLVSLDIYWHKRGWNGYDWNTDLLGDPADLLRFFHARNIHVTASSWPNKVPLQDSRFQQFLTEAGIEPPGPAETQWDDRDKLEKFEKYDWAIPRHARAFMEVLHQPAQAEGIDFWWVDQVVPVEVKNADHQLWTNHVFYTHAQAHDPDRRPLILGRACGLGAQRYPVHFTGDTWSYWPTLENQVEHTLRAGHLGQSFISHDVGGFIALFPFIDPELYLRWVQFGVLSPVFRLHSAESEKRPWLYGPQVLAAFKTAIRLRMEWVPYLYTLAWQSAQEGLPMCRSNALQKPEWNEGAEVWNSYYLGDRIYAAPVVTPGTVRQVLLPPGRWHSALSGEVIESDGRRPLPQIAPFNRPPLHYYPAGSIMIKQPASLRAATLPQTLRVEIYTLGEPCRDTFTLYEDDGLSRACERGEYSLLQFAMEESRAGLQLDILPAEGRFAGLPAQRNYEIHIFGRTCHAPEATAAVSVLQDGGFRLNGLASDKKHTVRLRY
jgi:hypothetical protein